MSSLKQRILPVAYHVAHAMKSIGRTLSLGGENSLRVLIYHDVPPAEQAQFAAQLAWLARSWKFVSPAQFAALISGAEPIEGRNLLVTFDDGFITQRHVAETVLKPMGIRALFFPVSDFIALQDRQAARDFIASNIQPGVDESTLPGHLCNMTWSDLEALLEQGHSIGAHTRTHARLSRIGSKAELEQEINSSGDALAQRLGVAIEHFAYTFGDLASFSPQALAVARRRFPYIYTGLRGDNFPSPTPWAIRREALAPADSLGVVGAFVEGVGDLKYARARAEIARWQG